MGLRALKQHQPSAQPRDIKANKTRAPPASRHPSSGEYGLERAVTRRHCPPTPPPSWAPGTGIFDRELEEAEFCLLSPTPS